MTEAPWSNLAVAPAALGLLAGVVLLLVRGPVLRRALASAACLAQLGLAGWLIRLTLDGDRMVLGVGGWAPPLGIVLVVDLLAAIMLALAAVMAAACHLYGFFEVSSKAEHPLRLPLWHFLLAGINLSFTTGDLFNLFVAFEVMLIASYALLTLEANDWDVKQAYPYVAMNLVGGSLFLIAVGFVYGVFGTLNMAQLAQRLAEQPDHPVVLLAGLLLFAVFALKAGVFPLYYWLPNSYPILAAPLGAFYAGMLTKVGVYVLLRIYGTVFPHDLAVLHQLMGWLAALTMVLAVMGAVSRGFVRGILSWHILSQIGYMVVAIGLFTQTAVAACIYYIVHHIIVKATLFLAGAAGACRCGSDDLDRVSGVARVSPWLAACFFLQAMSLAGVPPLSGFWGKFVIIVEGIRLGQWWWVAAAVAAGVLTLFSMLKIWNSLFWGEPGEAARRPADARFRGMLAACLLLTGLSLVIGLGVGPFFHMAETAAAAALDQAGYAADVLGIAGKGKGAP